MTESSSHLPSNPLISVIVPCYNQARFLPDAVHSLQSQTYPHWECLIVNDGSTDDTAAVGAALAETDGRVRLITQPNRGLAGARNRGLAEARGQFIQFLDADDAIRPPKFQRQLSDIVGAAGLVLSYCDFCMVPEEDLNAPMAATYADCRFQTENRLIELAARWETQLSIPCHCFFFDARFFTEHRIRFDEALPNHEDWDCWMRIFALKPAVSYVDAKLAVYRFRAQSMCRDMGKMRRGYLAALAKQQTLFAQDREMAAVLRRKRREIKQVYRDYGAFHERLWMKACLRGRQLLRRTAKVILPQAGLNLVRPQKARR